MDKKKKFLNLLQALATLVASNYDLIFKVVIIYLLLYISTTYYVYLSINIGYWFHGFKKNSV